MKKTNIALLLLLTVILGCAPGVSAEIDYDYDGELDIGGNPERGDSDPDKREVTVGDAVYDKLSRRYRYAVGDSAVEMNLPNGIITTSAVSVIVPTGMKAKFYRDGTELTEFDPKSITEAGKYVAYFGNADELTLKFTIVKQLTGAISSYQMPSGFRVTSVTLDGEAVPFDSYYVDLTEEGSYEIRCSCAATGVTHGLNVRIDHTPPTLKLEAVKDGYADGPVDISDLEKDASISITLDDKAISRTKTLTKSGTYRLQLRDKAGNYNEYNFAIRIYFDSNSIMFLVIVALAAAALAGYLIYSRKHLRIR